MRIANLVLILLLALPQLAQAQYGNPETGYTAPPGTQPAAPPAASAQGGQVAAPASDEGESGIRLAMQTRFSAVNVLNPTAADFRVTVLATPGLRLADDKLFIGLGVGWVKANHHGGHGYTIAPTATYDLIQRTNAALHLLVIMNISDQSGGDLIFGMNFGLGVRALLGESFAIGTEWGFAFTQVDGSPMGTDAAFGFFGALMLESSIGL